MACYLSRLAAKLSNAQTRTLGGCNSVVEYLLPKQRVVGSNPITRSKISTFPL